MPGIDWANNFLRRNHLSLRIPQKTSITRIMGFNKVHYNLFFDYLTQRQQKYKFPPIHVYDMDEMGIITVPNKAPKLVATVGKRAVGKVVAAERPISDCLTYMHELFHECSR